MGDPGDDVRFWGKEGSKEGEGLGAASVEGALEEDKLGVVAAEFLEIVGVVGNGLDGGEEHSLRTGAAEHAEAGLIHVEPGCERVPEGKGER
jgi:hypothetical protein